MATELGYVVKIKGKNAIVRTRRMEACEGCSEHDVCHGTGNIKENEFEAKNPINAALGDTVILEFNSFKLVKLSFLLYVFPVIALIAGAFIGERFAPQLCMDKSLCSVIGAFALFGAAMGLIMLLERRARKTDTYKPVIVKIKKDTDPSAQKCSLSNMPGGFKPGGFKSKD